MRHSLPFLIVLVGGCASMPLSAYDVPRASRVGFAPTGTDIGGPLLAASETEWHKEVDVGPQRFDEEGMPVVAQPQRGTAGAQRFKRFGLRFGGLTEVYLMDEGSDFSPDGPVVGAYLRLGGRGHFALEFGYDHMSIQAESWSTWEPESYSDLEVFRTDANVFLAAEGTGTRLYLIGGVRFMVEQTEVFTGYGDESFTNSASGWGVGGGILTGSWDLKIEHFEVDAASSGAGFTHFTVAYRF